MEAQVDTSGYASRREDVAVVDEEAVGQHVDLGVAVLELSGPPPVGGGGTVVEDTSRGEGKSGGADRYQSGAPAFAARMASRTAVETVASTSSYPGMITVSARLAPSSPAGVLIVNPEPGSDTDRPSAHTVSW
jgi:hypothetical protein